VNRGLAVSNLAWNSDEEPAALSVLRDHGFCGIEVAPTKLWPDWQGADIAAAAAARRRFADDGFAVPALQAILFGRPMLKIFGDDAVRARTLDHFRLVADLAAALGAACLVFGAPANRNRLPLDEEAAFARAVEFFGEVGAVCVARGVCVGIEPIPPPYGGNFATRLRDVLALVAAVQHPGVRLLLDVGCVYLGGDDPVAAVAEAAPYAAHVHVSEPHLGPLTAPVLNHAALGEALAGSPYAGWISLEMKRGDGGIADLRRAVATAAAWYGHLA